MTSGAWTLRRAAFGLVPKLHAADAKQRALARCLVPSSLRSSAAAHRGRWAS